MTEEKHENQTELEDYRSGKAIEQYTTTAGTVFSKREDKNGNVYHHKHGEGIVSQQSFNGGKAHTDELKIINSKPVGKTDSYKIPTPDGFTEVRSNKGSIIMEDIAKLQGDNPTSDRNKVVDVDGDQYTLGELADALEESKQQNPDGGAIRYEI